MLIFPYSGLREYQRKIVLLLDGSLGHVEFLPVSKLQLFVQKCGYGPSQGSPSSGCWGGEVSLEGWEHGRLLRVESSAGDLVGCLSRVGVGISVSFVAS